MSTIIFNKFYAMDVIKGSDLKLLLKRKGITSTYLSEKLSIHKSQISRYFTDDIAMPANFIVKVAKLASLEISDLIKMDKDDIVSEPAVPYKKIEKMSTPANVDVIIDGVSITDYIQKVEKRLSEMERSVMDLHKKGYKVMELADV